MISRYSEARNRTVNRSERSSETTTDDTTAGYRRTSATSIDAMRTVFLVGRGESRDGRLTRKERGAFKRDFVSLLLSRLSLTSLFPLRES
jgi:hypothetical protein